LAGQINTKIYEQDDKLGEVNKKMGKQVEEVKEANKELQQAQDITGKRNKNVCCWLGFILVLSSVLGITIYYAFDFK